mgnify:CR=1 FL=1|tara:strand:- start:3862 stop:4050 length:189 start_codon:yes stop_codon:yes gene_type:complete
MTKFAMSVTEPSGQTTTIEFETIEELLTELEFFAGSHSGLKINCDIVTKNDSEKYSVEYNAV